MSRGGEEVLGEGMEGEGACAFAGVRQSLPCQSGYRMSPAHVERYIGSCLITSGYKPPRYRRYPDYGGYQAGGWAGLPLIAVSRSKKEDRSPLSRLAIHTQGAPLIQSGRGQGRRGQKPQQKPPVQKEVKEADSEPANSENSLPRIIKPRKRRKKERKPPQESAIVTLKPYTPLCSDIPEEQPASPGGEEIAECQCRYCDPLGVIWEANADSDGASWPGGEKEEEDPAPRSGLEVSSQIVTSPNGHRDIEIRFFTTPPPQPQQPPRPVSVSPPWR